MATAVPIDFFPPAAADERGNPSACDRPGVVHSFQMQRRDWLWLPAAHANFPIYS